MEVVEYNGWHIEVLPGVRGDRESLERVKELLQLIDDVARGKHNE